jgi:hypothetical protein
MADALRVVASSPLERLGMVTAGDVTVDGGGVADSVRTSNGGNHLPLLEAELDEVYAVLNTLQSAVWQLVQSVPVSGERKDAICIPRVAEALRLMKTELGVEVELPSGASFAEVAAVLGRVGDSILDIARQSHDVREG